MSSIKDRQRNPIGRVCGITLAMMSERIATKRREIIRAQAELAELMSHRDKMLDDRLAAAAGREEELVAAAIGEPVPPIQFTSPIDGVDWSRSDVGPVSDAEVEQMHARAMHLLTKPAFVPSGSLDQELQDRPPTSDRFDNFDRLA